MALVLASGFQLCLLARSQAKFWKISLWLLIQSQLSQQNSHLQTHRTTLKWNFGTVATTCLLLISLKSSIGTNISLLIMFTFHPDLSLGVVLLVLRSLRKMSALEMASTVLQTTTNQLRALSSARTLFWKTWDSTACTKNLSKTEMKHYGGTTSKMFTKNALNTFQKNALRMHTKRLMRTTLQLWSVLMIVSNLPKTIKLSCGREITQSYV